MKAICKIFPPILLALTLCACERDAPLNLNSSDIPAVDNSATVAASQSNYCATAIAKGFADDIRVSVCVDAQGNILSVTSENHETAGLGTRAVEEMGETMMRENSELVDAVSEATISSSAFHKAAGEAYMVAYAKSQGMVYSDPDNPMVGVWRWDSNDVDFEKAFWLIYPNGLLVPYSVERNENMVSLRDVHQDERNVVYHDSTLSLVRGGDAADSLPIEWIDRDHFSLPNEGEFYYFATRVQIDDDILTDDSSAANGNPNDKGSLTMQRLCESVWVSNGYRLSDTTVCQFNMDGTIKITDSVSTPDEYYGTFELRDDTVIMTWNGSSVTLTYDKEKNILINTAPSATHIVEQDHGDSAGNYVPAKTAREIYEPYSAVPYLDSGGQAQLQSVPPEEFSETCIKETVRPYLQALSYISIPQRYCELSWDDTFMDERGMTYFRVMNYGSVQEAIAAVAPYVTDEYLQAAFRSDGFQVRDGKLYLIESSMGWPSWDANSVAYAGLVGIDEIAVKVDSYGSGDNYCGTETIYFRETEDGFVISGFSWITEDKGYPSYDYTAPGYDPV